MAKGVRHTRPTIRWVIPRFAGAVLTVVPALAGTRQPINAMNKSFRPPRHSASGAKPADRLGAASSLVRVECNSGADMLSYTHAFFSAYCEGHFRPHTAQRLAVGTFELLENGLNYGAITQKVVIELLRGNDCFVIRVTNGAIQARVAMLLEHLVKIRANPEATFLEEMRKSMSGTGQRAMLGLARLAHEARLELSAHAEDGRVVVEAYCPD
jgi:hypothetical protein